MDGDLILKVLVIAEAVALVVGVPLLSLYLTERVRNLAREASDKVLADYKHTHDAALAELSARHQRELKEFGLYRQKRHIVYAELYRRFSVAADMYSAFVGLTMVPDFSRYDAQDAEEYFQRHDVPGSMRPPIIVAIEAGSQDRAKQLLTTLHHRIRVRDASKAFERAKNCERVNELFLSDAVRAQLHAVRVAIAALSVAVESDDGRDRDEMAKRDTAQTAISVLFKVMRDEMNQE